METARPTGTDSARLVTLIETESKRGIGTREDLHRIVFEYWTLDGHKVAEYDPVKADFTAACVPIQQVDAAYNGTPAAMVTHNVTINLDPQKIAQAVEEHLTSS